MAHFSQSREEGVSHLHSDGNSACQSYHKSSGKSQKSKALPHQCTSHYHMRWAVPSLRAELFSNHTLEGASGDEGLAPVLE